MLTVSIVSHGQGALVTSLLADLQGQVGVDRVLVVLTLNKPGEEFEAEAWSDLTLKLIKNDTPKGFGANHNAAFAISEGAWFLIVNPDIRMPDAHTLLRYLSEASLQARVAVCAPSIVGPSGELEDAVRSNLTPGSLAKRVFRKQGQRFARATSTSLGKPFFWLAGMFLAVERGAFAHVKGFDERFFLYCEDYDLCARLYLAGYTLQIDAETLVVHDARRDSHRSLRYLLLHVRSLLRVWLSRTYWQIVFQARHTPKTDRRQCQVANTRKK